MEPKTTTRIYASAIMFILLMFSYSCKNDNDDGVEPPVAETVIDIDGNVYQTVTIGTQVWMKENLAVVHYRNGDPVLNILDGDAWSIADTGAYCNIYNDTSKVKTYGRLYNWYAVNDSRLLSPAGWHIPSDNEWKQLEMFLGMTQQQADSVGTFRGTSEGGKLKVTGTKYWISPNFGATNSSGFSALPAGYRTFEFIFENMYASWWTATKATPEEAIFRGVSYDESKIVRSYYIQDERLGLSVRCVKD
jgi:uncharacterized protein (TIGR02145 family)